MLRIFKNLALLNIFKLNILHSSIQEICFLLLIALSLSSCRLNDSTIRGTVGPVLKLETMADGTGLEVINQNLAVGQSLNFYAIQRSSDGKFTGNVEVSWVLNGGVGNLTVLSSGKEAQFNATVVGTAEIKITSNNTSKIVKITISPEVLSSFDILGVTATGDSLTDNTLGGDLKPTFTWSASDNAAVYNITVFENNGTTVACPTQTVTDTSYDFSACTLTGGQTYKVQLIAKDTSGLSTKMATSYPYSFRTNASPTITTPGPWYVMTGDNIVINAQFAASPSVGTAQDSDGDTLTFSAIGTPSGAGASIVNNSTNITYTAGTYIGVDSVTFTISDGLGGTVDGTMQVFVVSPYTWTGGGGDSDWATGANWCGAVNANKDGCTNTGASPSITSNTGHVAVFNSICSTNCSATLNSNASYVMYGLNLQSGYTGTVQQVTGKTMTFGAGGFVQDSGTFLGGNSLIKTSGGIFVNSGTFTSTSGTFDFNGTAYGKNFTLASGATFNHNSGIFYNVYDIKVPTGTQLYDVTYNQGVMHTAASNGIPHIMGTFTVTATYSGYGGGGCQLNTFEVHGDVVLHNYGVRQAFNYCSGSKFRIAGTGNQTITGDSSDSGLENIEVDKPSGTLTINGGLAIRGYLTVLQGSILGSPDIKLLSINGTANLNFDGLTLNSLSTEGVWIENWILTSTTTVLGDVSLKGTSWTAQMNGNLLVGGNVILVDQGVSNVNIEMNGTLNQSISHSGAALTRTPNFVVNNSGSGGGYSVTVSSNLPMQGASNFSITQGDVNLFDNTITMDVPGTLTLNTGTVFNQNGGTLTYGTLSNSGTLNP